MQGEFVRTAMLVGEEGLARIQGSHILVCGLGGVGSHCAEALARAGVGRLTLVDHDRVSLSNINRQCIALHSTLGQYKTKVMGERIWDINPRAFVEAREEFILPENVKALFCQEYDYVVDAVDTVTAKLAIIGQAQERQIPVISCMGTGNKIDPAGFAIADLYETSVCPLCRVMRRECRKRGIEHLKVLYSREQPKWAATSGEATGDGRRSVPASISFVPPVAGLMMAGEIIREIIDKEV